MKKNILKTALIIFTAVNMHAQNSGINLANMDKSVNPCDDFYTFCNGAWLKKTQIPAQESMWGSFDELADYNNNNLKKILKPLPVLPFTKCSLLRPTVLRCFKMYKSDKLRVK